MLALDKGKYMDSHKNKWKNSVQEVTEILFFKFDIFLSTLQFVPFLLA